MTRQHCLFNSREVCDQTTANDTAIMTQRAWTDGTRTANVGCWVVLDRMRKQARIMTMMNNSRGCRCIGRSLA
jgi:hypothetical protein